LRFAGPLGEFEGFVPPSFVSCVDRQVAERPSDTGEITDLLEDR